MLVKCSKGCGIQKRKGNSKKCLYCQSPITRCSGDELRRLADAAMDRSRAVRAMIECVSIPERAREMRLAAFMGIFHGRNMNQHQVKQMLETV